MIDIHEFRERISVLHEADSNDKTVFLTGNSLDDILVQASVELQAPQRQLSYEVLEEGYPIFYGLFGRKKWKVLVFYSANSIKARKKAASFIEAKPEIKKDADFGLRLSIDGNICFRAIPAEGEGSHSIDLKKVQDQAKNLRVLNELNTELVEQIAADPDSEWHSVGKFTNNTASLCQLGITISEDSMKATLVITTTGSSATPTAQELSEALLKHGVFFGVKEEVLENLESHPVFRTPILVAEGQNPQNGNDSCLKCLFDTSRNFEKTTIENDSPDQREGSRHYANNVEAGQVIAEVLRPSQGIPGRTVRGELISAKAGNYVDLPIGENVQLTDDASQLIAKKDGRVVYIDDCLSVESVLIINGDVKSYINFLGTVVISGNVEDGYEINAKGNIHIDGTVGRSRITSAGDIYVGGGINGDKDASSDESDGPQVFIKCGGSIWAKFIQNCYLEADEFVVVSDGILNSEVIALKKVLCRGKRTGSAVDNRRAAIIGGRIRACEEISAVILGSSSGTPTRLEVGVNPRLQDEYDEFSRRFEARKIELADLEKSIENWKRSSKIKTLTPDKQNRFNEISEQHEILKQELENDVLLVEQKGELLKNSTTSDRISASSRVCVGVTMAIHSAEYTVSNEYHRPITFMEEKGLVIFTEYEESKDDVHKQEAPIESQKNNVPSSHSRRKNKRKKGV